MEPTTAQISAFPVDHPGTPIDQPPLYETVAGACFVGDAQDLLSELPSSSIDLVVTSSLYAPSSRKSRCGPVRLDRWGPAPDAVSRQEPAATASVFLTPLATRLTRAVPDLPACRSFTIK